MYSCSDFKQSTIQQQISVEQQKSNVHKIAQKQLYLILFKLKIIIIVFLLDKFSTNTKFSEAFQIEESVLQVNSDSYQLYKEQQNIMNQKKLITNYQTYLKVQLIQIKPLILQQLLLIHFQLIQIRTIVIAQKKIQQLNK